MFNALSAARVAAPLLALGATLGGCEQNMLINGQEGVPLAELEIAGPPPTDVVLSSGDTVILTNGNTFAITVEGSDTDSLRFVRDDKVIGVTRESGWNGKGTATIRITMPPPEDVIIAGSGTVRAQNLASTSEITIGGSGLIEFGAVAAEKLGINIGGSGTVRGAGTARRLEVNIGGAGDVEMPSLKADNAEVNIGGTGDVAFASDGEVSATIAGAGDVRVSGAAKCAVETFGSGALTCTPTSAAAAAPAAIPADMQVPQAPMVPVGPAVPAAPNRAQ
ncbi:head GIN domain-containing protein [Erythrobacter sp. R86502]|uniref:head GIN domain-containing protein n=1 Tax=Erythrobacter sp. R86502 TaxID=3093846 RepID=UPI0036D3A8B6